MGTPMQNLLILRWKLCKLILEPVQKESVLRSKFPPRSFIHKILFVERLDESFRAMKVNRKVLRNLNHPGRELGPLGSLKPMY